MYTAYDERHLRRCAVNGGPEPRAWTYHLARAVRRFFMQWQRL